MKLVQKLYGGGNSKKEIKKINYPYKYVFLLVRPNLFYQKGSEFSKYLGPKTIVVSCMAGVTVNRIQKKAWK